MDVDSEREDGEIVDDDDVFEDVSDCSIISPVHSGKSFTYQDIIPTVSLSSISESEVEVKQPKKVHEQKRKRRKRKYVYKPRLCRKRRRKHSTSGTAGEEKQLDRTFLRQLKEAVRIDSSYQSTHNNLQVRIKRMLNGKEDIELCRKSGSDSNNSYEHINFNRDHRQQGPDDEDEELKMLRSLALNTKQDSKMITNDSEVNFEKRSLNDSLDDNELFELRLAALKSAVIKKHIKRKKRKELEQFNPLEEKPVDQDMDKENTSKNKEGSQSKSNEEIAEVKEVIIDAYSIQKLLPGNCSKDSTKSSEKALNTTVEEDIDIMRAMLLASMSNKITANNGANSNNIRSIPPSNPKILKNSETLNVYKQALKNNKPQVNPILKMPEVKPLIININGESESDSDVEDIQKPAITSNVDTIALKVTELLKKTRAEVEANAQATKVSSHKPPPLKANDSTDSSLMDKSVVKLLPKSQQLEYHLLKQKLLNAKNKRVKQASQKMLDKKHEALNCKMTVAAKAKSMLSSGVSLAKPNGEISSLKATLKDMQLFENERLQMKGKYKELVPLLRKVNQTSVQKKKYEHQINRLLDELKHARKALSDSQLYFTKLVKELILKKEGLDKRLMFPIKALKPNVNITGPSTSTPIKAAKEIVPPTTDQQLPEKIEQPAINTEQITEQPSETIAPQTQEEIEETKTTTVEGGGIAVADNFCEYISPLGSTTRGPSADPLGTFCPYEIFGVCKDAECTYKHYS